MKAVGIRELKNKLSEYIRQVARGERILVTDRGSVVAELRPPSSVSAEEVRYPRLLELANHGQVRLGAPNRPELYIVGPISMPEGTAIRLLDAERGEH